MNMRTKCICYLWMDWWLGWLLWL